MFWWNFCFIEDAFGLHNASSIVWLQYSLTWWNRSWRCLQMMFLVFDLSFDHYLHSLSFVLERYGENNLVLNCEKFHFMRKEGIVLGHKILSTWLQVDRSNLQLLRNFLFQQMWRALIVFLAMQNFMGGSLNIS